MDNPRVVPTEVYNRRCNLLSKSVCAFKTTSSKKIHLAGGYDFKWQRSFYDQIIRNQEMLDNATRYIQNNPKNWGDDRNNPGKF